MPAPVGRERVDFATCADPRRRAAASGSPPGNVFAHKPARVTRQRAAEDRRVDEECRRGHRGEEERARMPGDEASRRDSKASGLSMI